MRFDFFTTFENQYIFMNYFYFTEKFTLSPKKLRNPDYLRELFTVEEQEEIREIELPCYNAILTFAEPTAAKSRNNGDNNVYPFIYTLLNSTSKIEEYNKILIYFNRERQMTQIVAAEGEKLLLANTYKTVDFKSALYFIALVTQQTLFNPQLTKIHVYGTIEPEEESLLKTYYQGVAIESDPVELLALS